MKKQAGFFDLEDRYAELSKAGDPLEQLDDVVNFEAFRYRLNKALKRSDGRQGGRPAYDVVLMFKVLVLQSLYNLPDERTEFAIRDRLSFMRFLGIGVGDRVPDATTIWLFREQLTQSNAIEKLFVRFETVLQQQGYSARSGQILDASLIAAPRQHNTSLEKEAIIEGKSASEIWPDTPSKAAQKDTDARWTVKFSQGKVRLDGSGSRDLAIPVFGYKNHIGIDRRYGLIRKWDASSASVHDSRKFAHLLDQNNTACDVWADTAYRSKANEALLEEKGLVSRIHRKKPRGKAMPMRTAQANNTKSRIRARVEHVFAVQKGTMGLFIRSIGLARARTRIGMANLTYNMKRLIWLKRRVVPT